MNLDPNAWLNTYINVSSLKFNLDENIKVNVNYNKSSDEIYYSLVLFYKY